MWTLFTFANCNYSKPRPTRDLLISKCARRHRQITGNTESRFCRFDRNSSQSQAFGVKFSRKRGRSFYPQRLGTVATTSIFCMTDIKSQHERQNLYPRDKPPLVETIKYVVYVPFSGASIVKKLLQYVLTVRSPGLTTRPTEK